MQTTERSRNRQLPRRGLRVTLVALAAVLGAGCSSDSVPDSVPSLTGPALERAAEAESIVSQWDAAWETSDPEALAATLDDGFVFNEPSTTNMPKDRFVEFMTPFMTPDVTSTDLRVFSGGDDVVELYLVSGLGGADENAPVVEVDLLTTAAGKITSLRSMYGADILRSGGLSIPTELISDYEEAWSSGDPGKVEALYAESAVRSEPLYGVELQGSTEIGRYATAFYQRHPGATLSIVEPYVFGDGANDLTPTFGTLFSLVDSAGCEIQYVVLLEKDDSDAITRERVYHGLDTVQTCDWQG